MPADARIQITAENQTQQAFKQTEASLKALESQARDVQQASRITAQAFDHMGDEASEAAVGVTSLGRSIFRTQEQAKRFNGVWRSLDGRLREANGRFVSGREAVDRLTGSFGGASRGAGVLTRSVSGLGNVLGVLSIAAVTHEIARFGITSVQTAGRLDQLQRALTNIEGSSEAAQNRFESLVEVANRPGLQLEALVQYSNRLSAAGLAAEDIDKILLTVGETVVSLGGSAATSALAMEQLIQAVQLGKVDFRDFRTIVQQIPGFLEALGDVHQVEANLDGLHQAFAQTGGSIRDLVIPVFDELAERFEAPPADSYIVVMDTLENSFTLLQGAIGDLFLPAVIDAAMALTNFFEAARAGLKDVNQLPPEIQAIVAGAKDLYDGLQNVIEAITSGIGPEIRALVSTLATLLGSVLDLAGSIANVLAPAYELWNYVNALVLGLINKLAQDITGIIDVLTGFVDWIASAWQEEDRFTESTQQVTKAIEEVKDAATDASGSFQEYTGNLSVLLTELQSVNAELEQKRKRLKELEEEGLTPADASLQQIQRQIGLLEERSKSLTESLPNLNKALEDVTAQLAEKENRLAGLKEGHQGATSSAQQLQRQIETLETVTSLLNAQIALTPPALSETSDGMNTATEAVENYSLTLARLKARAEDARETLSDTIDFQQLSANYQAAIAESDAYYDRQIANAEAALSNEKENTDEYRKLETDLFELRREKEQARQKITEAASKVGETESKRRLKVAETENEHLREAGEETARALEASQKAQAAATAETQKELTRIHQENLKQQEANVRAANQRIVKASEDQLKILENIFENSTTEGVNQAYQNIQRATIEHYETLKSQARQRIRDEDALTAELVKLDRERNAALGENHRDYLQRIAKDAKDLLGERTEAFQESSTDILHDWERTVSAFERQLREADTEDAIREIEANFETGQQNMLASLESVLIELGFTAEQTSEIMKDVLQTAESESDSFADKIISAFKQLGKEVERETKRQNRELEREYKELIDNIADTIGQVGDLLGDGLGGTLESVFSGFVRTASGDLFGLVDIATSAISFIQQREEELHRRRQERAKERQEFENEQSIRVQNIQTVQQILPNAESNIRRPRPRDEEAELNRGVNARRRVRAELQDLQGITLSGVSSDVLSQLQSQQLAGSLAALTTNLDDIIQRSDIEELYTRFLNSFETAMDSAGLSFQTAIDRGLSDADITAKSSEFLGAINDFYDLQIEQIRNIEAATGAVLFDEIQAINNLRSERLNQARLLSAESTRPNLTAFGYQRSVQEARATAERTGADRQATEDVARAQYGDEAYDAEVAAAVDQEALASVIESINEDVALINASITAVETQIEQSNEPTEIAELLSQVPDLIREKYTRLREALQQRFDADEISQDVFDASLSELQSSESRDLESHSDAVLANTIQAINEDVSLINASVASIQTQIDQLSEPEAIAELLSQVPDLIREKYQQLHDALDARYNAGEISTDIYNASLSELANSETSELEQHSDAVLANTLRAINEDVQLIDASITALQTQINGLSDPEAIAELLNQLPALIQEKYQTLRTALDTRYAAGEISLDVYSASISQLASSEAAAIESHSDQVLANTLRTIDEDAQLVNASITALQNQIDQTSEPAEIARLLDQLPALITEKYRLLRNALDEKYAAGEISADVYNASLSQLSSSQASETEAQSDAVLANTLSDIDDDVELIDANIGALQAAVEQSDDPEAVAGLLDTIKILVMDKYKRLRERLDELHTAEEISTDSYNAALTALGTAESRELAGIDTQALNAISEAAQEQVDFINGGIENLRTSLELTDDPTEIQQILDAIKVLTVSRFDILRAELEAIRDTLKPEAYEQALEGLNLGEQLALENLDTEKFAAISADARKQVDFINGSIENLRLSFQLTDDPAEAQQILDAIKVLTAQRFAVLRDELEKLKDTLDDDKYDEALKGINLAEQVALDQIDTEKFNEISAAAQEQVEFINGGIENLRLSLQLTDDPAETQQILDAIKILTANRFKILRDELNAIRASFDNDDQFKQALMGINLAEQLAIQNLDTEKFETISVAAQEQVDLINGSIENLQLSLQLTDDPADRQAILDAIKILTAKRFDILIQELKDIRENFDNDDQFKQALTGLELGKTLALENIDTEKFTEISAEARGQVDFINTDIENLRLAFQLADDPMERQQILDAIKTLISARFDVLRDELEKIRGNLKPGEYEQALKGFNLAEQVALNNIDTEKFSEISAAAQKQVDFINTDIENLRLALQLADDPTEQQEIIDAIKILTAKRFEILRDELIAIRDSFKSDTEFNQALQGLNLGERLALSQLDTERFGVISEAAQEQVDFINGAISNLELSLQLTEDPDEIQRILTSIRILTAKRFDVLIDELKALEDSFDSDAEFNQALEGLQLGKAVALRGLDDRSIGVTLAGIGDQISAVDFEINQFFGELESKTTDTGVRTAIGKLRTAIEKKYELLREKINASAETEEEKARQLEGIDFQEGQALDQLGQRRLGQFNSLLDTAQFLLDTATETEFSTRRESLINAINTFYDERIRFIESQDLSDTDRVNMQTVAEIQRDIALNAVPQMHQSVVERLALEKDLQNQIQDLREESFDLEVERQDRLVALEKQTQERISDIQARAIEQREDALRRSYFALEDLTIEFARDFEDLFRESGLDIDSNNLSRLQQAIRSGFDISDDLLQQLNIELDEETRRELEDLTREFSRDRQDLQRERQNKLLEIQIQEQRSIADARNASEQRIIEINTRLVTGQQELTTAIQTLTAQLETVSTDEGIQAADGGLQAVEAVTTIATEASTAAQSSETAAGLASETSAAMEMTAGHLVTVTETQNAGVVERLNAMVQRLDTLIETNQELLGVTLLGSEILPREQLGLLGINVPTGLDFGIRNQELLEAFGQTVSDTRLPDTLQNFISDTEQRLRNLGREDEFPRFLNELQTELPAFISDAIGREFRGAPTYLESQYTLDEVTRNIASQLRLPTVVPAGPSPIGIPPGSQQLFNAQGQPVEVVFNFNLDSRLQWEDGATQSLGNSLARVNVNRSGLE